MSYTSHKIVSCNLCSDSCNLVSLFYCICCEILGEKIRTYKDFINVHFKFRIFMYLMDMKISYSNNVVKKTIIINCLPLLKLQHLSQVKSIAAQAFHRQKCKPEYPCYICVIQWKS